MHLSAGANSNKRESSESELHDANGYLEKAKNCWTNSKERMSIIQREWTVGDLLSKN